MKVTVTVYSAANNHRHGLDCAGFLTKEARDTWLMDMIEPDWDRWMGEKPMPDTFAEAYEQLQEIGCDSEYTWSEDTAEIEVPE